jgi:hypothetical protein
MNGIIFEMNLKKIYMKSLLIFSIAIIIFGCKSHKNAQNSKIETNSETMLKATIGDIETPSDLIQITDVSVKGNIMSINVSYSGGCQEHSFQLIGSANIAKSLPPIRSVKLVHNANGDACRELKEDILEFDITDLAYVKTSGSVIYLTINGWKDRIEYTFE